MTRHPFWLCAPFLMAVNCEPPYAGVVAAFDGECDGCGYTVLEGRAEVVETFHAGDKGLQLEPSTRVRLSRSTGEGASVSLTARCQGGGLTVALQAIGGGDGGVEGTPRVLDAEGPYFQRFGVSVPSSGGSTVQLETGPGTTCIVDDVVATTSTEVFPDTVAP